MRKPAIDKRLLGMRDANHLELWCGLAPLQQSASLSYTIAREGRDERYKGHWNHQETQRPSREETLAEIKAPRQESIRASAINSPAEYFHQIPICSLRGYRLSVIGSATLARHSTCHTESCHQTPYAWSASGHQLFFYFYFFGNRKGGFIRLGQSQRSETHDTVT
ncbi:hypothetical protein LZ31DRAFT_17011 [Colletotrichum somersetense]|nr:hypothetical protein LZ31DRAFT_17011 [Colletotrichum somersetense]